MSVDDPDLETNKHVALPDTEEQTRSVVLLTDPEIGLSEEMARGLAASHQFDWLERHAYAYLRDLATGRAQGTGALVNRIRQGWRSGELTDEDRTSELYARHHDLAEERRRKYIPDEFSDVILG